MLPIKMKAAFLVAVLIPSLEASASQDCIELARTIVYNNTRSYSELEQRQMNKADFCSERFKQNQSGRSLAIQASYKVLFSGGVEGSEQQIQAEQERQCEGQYGDFWLKKIESKDARIASADALAVVNSCLALHAKGLSQSATIKADGSEFAMSLKWSNDVPVPVRVNYMGPTSLDGYKCHVQNDAEGMKQVRTPRDTSANIPNGGSHTLTCKLPPPTKVLQDGEEVVCYQETLMTIAAAGPSQTIKFPKVCSQSMPGKRAEAIEKRIKEAEQTIHSLSNQLKTVVAAREGDSTYVKGELGRLDNAVKDATKRGVAGLAYHWAGSPDGLTECVRIQEPADSTHLSWDDNFLCLRR